MAEEDNAGMVDVEDAAPEQAKEEEPAAEGGKTMVAGVALDETQLPLFVALIASIVLLIATTSRYNSYSGYASYVISVSCIAMILSFFALVLNKFSEDMYEKVGKHMNTLNFAYSFVGACFLTFREPFTGTGNGYFAAWALAFATAFSVGMTKEAFGSTVKGMDAMMGLLVASVVVFVASIDPIRDGYYKSEAIFAIVMGAVSFVYIMLQVCLEKKDKNVKGMAHFGVMAILAVAWIVEACFVTFRGPFEVTGNGYFGSWAAAMTASVAAFSAKKAL